MRQACQAIYDELPARARSGAVSAAEVASLRRFAGCMRDHGVSDWPDPDAEGSFHFPPSLEGDLKQGPR